LTKKPKKLSSDYLTLLASSLTIPLVGLFVYASFSQVKFFTILASLQSLVIIFLIVLRNLLIKRQSFYNLRNEEYREKANLLESEITKEAHAVFSFRDKIENYFQLKDLTERLSMCLTLNDTSNVLSEEVNKLFKHQDVTVILYIFQSKTGELGISSSQKGQMRVNIKSKKGDIFDQFVVKTMQPLLIEDSRRDFRFDFDKINKDDARTILSLMNVPLLVGNKTLGLLRVDSPIEGHFKTEDLRLLKTVGDLGAVAIENAQLYEKVEELAIKDSLTDLYLRRHLIERLSQEMSRVLRRHSSLSFLMIDLDKFKQYNDKFGHVAGDIVLRTVGMILTHYFQDPGDLICRYGGEEFAVLLPDCPKEKAIEIAEDLRKKIEQNTILLRRKKTNITVSIGVASFPEDAKLKDELIGQADQALYEAKQKGRNRVCAAQ